MKNDIVSIPRKYRRPRALLVLVRFEFFRARVVARSLCQLDLVLGFGGLDGRVFFQFTLRIEAPGENVGSRDKRQHMVGKNQHGHQQLLGTDQLLGSGAALAAAFDGARYLGKMEYPEIRLGVPFA